MDISSGILEAGQYGISITSGDQLRFQGIDIYKNGSHSISITGLSGSNLVSFYGCNFGGNNFLGTASTYDAYVVWGMSSVSFFGCQFLSNSGTTSGLVVSHIFDRGSKTRLFECNFAIVGHTVVTGHPDIINRCYNYNPIGSSIQNTPGSIPPSGVAESNHTSVDAEVYITANASSTCAVAIGGTTVLTVPAGATDRFFIPASQTITLTYTAAPTWQWIGN